MTWWKLAKGGYVNGDQVGMLTTRQGPDGWLIYADGGPGPLEGVHDSQEAAMAAIRKLTGTTDAAVA
jgi:hypothetical protein